MATQRRPCASSQSTLPSYRLAKRWSAAVVRYRCPFLLEILQVWRLIFIAWPASALTRRSFVRRPHRRQAHCQERAEGLQALLSLVSSSVPDLRLRFKEGFVLVVMGGPLIASEHNDLARNSPIARVELGHPACWRFGRDPTGLVAKAAQDTGGHSVADLRYPDGCQSYDASRALHSYFRMANARDVVTCVSVPNRHLRDVD